MQGSDILFLIIFIIGYGAVISAGCYRIYLRVQKKQQLLVQNTSKFYKALLDLNSHYDFCELSATKVEIYKLKSKREFDNFDPWFRLMTRVDENRKLYKELLQQSKYNAKLYRSYIDEVDHLPRTNEIPPVKIKPEKYHNIEDELVRETVKKPVTKITFCIKWEYRSPKGRKFYLDIERYDAEEIKQIFKELKRRDNFKTTKEYQRTLMTPSLRYDVLKRDNFRCVLCGRDANDGVKLHVDHIRPVSKGGKTEFTNLRTLCNECNLGKSAKWDENALN